MRHLASGWRTWAYESNGQGVIESAEIWDGARWALILIFSLALLEKLHVLQTTSPRTHPVVQASRLLARFPLQSILISLGLDLASIVLLSFRPLEGALTSSGAILIYTVAGAAVFGGSETSKGNQPGGCRCFSGQLDTSSRTSFLIRNGVLLLMAISVAVTRPIVSVAGVAWGLGLVGLLSVAISVAEGRPLMRPSDPPGHGAAFQGDESHPGVLTESEIA